MKQTEILRSTPNTLGTFEALMLLGHTLHEKNGLNYSVKIDWKEDVVILIQEQ